MNRIIAIDGSTASGKGTLAKKISKHFNLPYLNTGGLYRAIAMFLIENKQINLISENKIADILKNVDFSNLDNPNLYIEDVGTIASKIAPILEVRRFLFDFQVEFANQPGGAVLDGRDIGTVICPNASYKFFIIADPTERAYRRYNEMLRKGQKVDYNEILNKILERDRSDMERNSSPLKKAEDAIEVDTTSMDVNEVFDYVLSFIRF